MQALALRPDEIPPNIVVQVQAVRPDGSRAELVRWNSRADWGRRYWFDKPIALPRGSRIEVVANLDNPDILSEAFAMTDSKAPFGASPLPLAAQCHPGEIEASGTVTELPSWLSVEVDAYRREQPAEFQAFPETLRSQSALYAPKAFALCACMFRKSPSRALLSSRRERP
jgi:hypothetical protein